MNWISEVIQPNISAEKAMLGTMLISPDTVVPGCEFLLTWKDFLVPEYQVLYKTINEFFFDGKPVDVITLEAQLGKSYREIIVDAIESIPSVKNWMSYAEIIRDTARRHRTVLAMRELSEQIFNSVSLEVCQQKAQSVVEALSTSRPNSILTLREAFTKYYASLQEEAVYLKTGIPGIDKRCFISKGDLIVIGARPSTGKTAIALQILLNMSKKHKIAFFSLETSHKNLAGRMLANISKIGLKELKMQKGIDYVKLWNATSLFNDKPIYTVEASGWSIQQIQATAIQLGVEVIFIDYLGLIRADGGSRYEKATNISIGLHTMAQDTKITVFALSQLSRPEKVSANKRPTLESLRETGQIEQDADVVMLLHSPEENHKSTRELNIAKNKEGETGAIRMHFSGDIQKFYELEEGYDAM